MNIRWVQFEGDFGGMMDIGQRAKNVKDGAIRLKDSVAKGFGKGMDTVTGRAVLEQVTKFAQETDAVNTAIVTRIYHVLDRQKKLEQENNDAQGKHRLTRIIACLSIALNACCIFAIVYILIFPRGK